MIYGWEDYDFWLSIIELGREVHSIPDALFYYRRKSGSMVEIMKEQHHVYSYATIFKNHHNLYSQNVEAIFSNLVLLRSRLHQTQSELERSQGNILAMESSKFWKLRQLWFKIKNKFRLRN